MSNIDDIVARYKPRLQRPREGDAYDPRQLPAKQYKSWADDFTDFMAAIQKEVEDRKAQRVHYQAVIDALRATESSYPQTFKVQCSNGRVTARADLLSSQHWSLFNPLVSLIVDNLIKSKLLEDGCGLPHPNEWSNVYWNIYTTDGSYVSIILDVPPGGNIYRNEERVTKYVPASTYVDVNYKWSTPAL